MVDPFAVQISEGMNDKLSALVRSLSIASRPSIENVHALLAYAAEPGVKDKFDARFGAGSAAAIIASAAKSDAISTIRDSISSLNEKVASLATAIKDMPQPNFDALISRIDDAVQRVENKPHPPIQEPTQPPTIDLSQLSSALGALASEIKVLQALSRAPRRVLTDLNGNVTGVKIEE